MNPAHIHLIITHLPIFGSALGISVLLYGLWSKSDSTLIAAWKVFTISAIGAVIAYLTGESAEELVEHLSGVSGAAIEEHEEAASFAFASMIVLGLVSIVSAILTWRKKGKSRTWAWVTLLVALFSFSVIARTGYLGGKIRHTEISGGNAGGDGVEQGGGEEEEED
jgi:uncharacterized membrane protein